MSWTLRAWRTQSTLGVVALGSLLSVGCGSQAARSQWSDRLGGWSPDGRLIVFSSDRPDHKQWDLYVMNADGSHLLRLTDDKLIEGTPVFLSGQKIAFAARGRAYTISLDRHVRHRLARGMPGLRRYGHQTPIGQANPEFIGELSPNHRWVAFTAPGARFELNVGGVKSTGRMIDLWLKRRDGSERRRLAAGAAQIDDPQWSPDSRGVAFSAVLKEGQQVYLMQVPNGKLRRLSHAAVSCCPTWTPDGRGLTYQSPDDSVVLVPSNGSGERTLPRNVPAAKVVLSPNETKALFEQRRGRYTRIEVVDLKSGKRKQLTQRL